MSIFDTISSIVSGVGQVAQVGAQVGQAFGIKELSRLGGGGNQRNLDPYTGGPLDTVMPVGTIPIASPIAAPTYNPEAYAPQGGGLDYGRYLRLAGKAGAWFAANYGSMIRAGSGGDFFAGQAFSPEYPENEPAQLVKLALARRAIPAQSDLGQALIAAGAKTSFVSVSYTDGTRSRVEVVKVGGGRGRVKRKNITRNRLTDAVWVMRKLHAQQKLGKRLVAAAHKLAPARRTCAKKAPARRR